MPKLIVKWTPETGSAREWFVDIQNPGWDVISQTEKATGWTWPKTINKILDSSAIALQALLFVLRKRDEPRLQLESVTFSGPAELHVEIDMEGEDLDDDADDEAAESQPEDSDPEA